MFGQEKFTFVPTRMRPPLPMDCLKAPQASLMKVGVILEKQHQPFPSIIFPKERFEVHPNGITVGEGIQV